MNKILKFKKKVAKKRSVLCANNHHQWVVVKEQQFDVKQGRLVTVERCKRCGKKRSKLT